MNLDHVHCRRNKLPLERVLLLFRKYFVVCHLCPYLFFCSHTWYFDTSLIFLTTLQLLGSVPMRCDYSESLKCKLWSGNLETHEAVGKRSMHYLLCFFCFCKMFSTVTLQKFCIYLPRLLMQNREEPCWICRWRLWLAQCLSKRRHVHLWQYRGPHPSCTYWNWKLYYFIKDTTCHILRTDLFQLYARQTHVQFISILYRTLLMRGRGASRVALSDTWNNFINSFSSIVINWQNSDKVMSWFQCHG